MKKEKKSRAGRFIRRFFLVVLTFLLVTFAGAYASLWLICHGPSPAARDLFVSTILETGQMKFLASWYFDEEEILAITGRNGMSRNEEEVDPGLIVIPASGPAVDSPEEEELPDMELCQILSNGLENAWEASQKLPLAKREASVQMRYSREYLIIRIRNRCAEGLHVEKGTIPATEKTETGHGFGLITIREAAERLSGNMFCYTDAGQFVLDVMVKTA